MIKTAIGTSKELNTIKAAISAATKAKSGLGEEPDLIIVFLEFAYNPEKIIEGVRTVFGTDIPIVGGSPGWGVITNEGLEEKGVAVIALKFEKLKIGISYVSNLSKDSLGAGMTLGEELKRGEQKSPKFVLLFLSGLGVAADLFLKGLREKLGANTNILGGGTGDGMALKSGGYQFCNEKVLTDSAVGVGFCGDFLIKLKAEHGWEPLGLPMKITKTKGNLVSEIDKKPAIKIFEQYFKKDEIMDPKFFTGEGEGILYPLGIILEEQKRIVVRQIVGAAPKGELVFATNMPEGVTIRLMQVQTEKMIKLATEVGKIISAQFKKRKPQLAFVFDCVTRKALLVPDHQKEINAFRGSIGKGVPLLGYFSYGEVCSRSDEKHWCIHNETFSAGLLAE